MSKHTDTSPNHNSLDNAAIEQLRIDLAACFRLIAGYGWNESVANHFSAAVSADGKQFLMNPKWLHFSRITASSLQLFDSNDANTMQHDNAPDPSAWCIHSAIHAAQPKARVLLHCHPPYITALSSLKDPRILPIDQNTARFYKRVTLDLGFGGLANDDSEGQRLAATFGQHNILLMGNHGVTVAGATVAEAFEDLYYFERACRTLMLAYQSGQPLSIMNDELAEKTAVGWKVYKGIEKAHFGQLKLMLDETEPGYKD